MNQLERDRMEAEVRRHGELKATPVKHKEALGAAQALHKLQEFASKPFGYNNPPGAILSEMMIGPVARTLERHGYGEPQTTGAGGLGGTTRPKQDLVDAALNVAPLAQATRGLPVGAAIKPKGGNWIKGAIPAATDPFKADNAMLNMLRTADPRFVDQNALKSMTEQSEAMNKWINTKLNRYIQNEMSTPEDPVLRAGEKFLKEEKPKLIADKEKQIAKARADLEKAQRERGVNPEMLTRSQERLRQFEKELRILEARTGFHSDFPAPHESAAPELVRKRYEAGLPIKGVAETEQGRNWEAASDLALSKFSAEDWLKSRYKSPAQMLEENPWLEKVDPKSPVYGTHQGRIHGQGASSTQMSHLVDELKNAMNPSSGLPPELLIPPAQLEKISVPEAVRRVDMINAWRAGQQFETDLARAGNAATQTYKEYPEEGLKWVELKAPEELPEGWTKRKGALGETLHYDPEGHMSVNPNQEALEEALRYEGEQLKHCVGGYCPDVLAGRSRIFSLRDKDGKPHATIEVNPGKDKTGLLTANELPPEELADMKARNVYDPQFMYRFNEQMGRYLPELGPFEPKIAQIKGLRNAAPAEKYQPYVQDFVRSGKWADVGDLQNAGLHKGEDLLKDSLNPIFNRAKNIILEQRPELTLDKSEASKILSGKYYSNPEEVASDILNALPAPPKPAAPEVKEQPMLQGFYRGYAGDYTAPAAAEETGTAFVTPQRGVAEYYANKRSMQTGEEPKVEMVLADPFAGKRYGHSTMGSGAQAPLTTVARKLAPTDIQSTTPLGSLREQNLQKYLEPSAEQGTWYHGTAHDIKEFNPALGLERPGQAGATFVSQSPEFAGSFAKDAQQYASQEFQKHLSPEQITEASKKAEDYFKKTYADYPEHRDEMIASLRSGAPQGEALDELMKASIDYMPAGPNIMPVHVRTEKPFDPAVAAHLEELRAINPNLPFDEIMRTSVLEDPAVQEAIKQAGFDAFYTTEGGHRNLGIFDPRRIKSALGNRGTYDIREPDITKKDGGIVDKAKEYAADAYNSALHKITPLQYMGRLAVLDAIRRSPIMEASGNPQLDTVREQNRQSMDEWRRHNRNAVKRALGMQTEPTPEVDWSSHIGFEPIDGQPRKMDAFAGGGSVDIPSDFTTPDMADGGGFFPDPDFMSLMVQNSR